MILFRKSGNETLKISAVKRGSPKLKSGHRGRTWDFDRHFINGEEVKMWIDTTWGEFVYFRCPEKAEWHKFRMVSNWRAIGCDVFLDFGQEFNIEFSTKKPRGN